MADPIIIWNTRDPLFGRTSEEYESELKRILDGRVRAAYFFGSYGTPEFGHDSDIDLILVVDTAKPFLDRALDFPEVFDLAFEAALLVCTPEELANPRTKISAAFGQAWPRAYGESRKNHFTGADCIAFASVVRGCYTCHTEVDDVSSSA